jgi:hypothetical protein
MLEKLMGSVHAPTIRRVPVPDRQDFLTTQELPSHAADATANAHLLDSRNSSRLNLNEAVPTLSSQQGQNLDPSGTDTSLSQQQVPLLPHEARIGIDHPAGYHGSASTRRDEPPKTTRPLPRMWNAFWLRWYILMSFGLLNFCCIVTLALLYYFSERDQGLRTESVAHQYAWKYGPTAFLTILSAFWQQIDYTCRSLEPWRNLAGGYFSEKETLMLDYVSANTFLVVYRALRKRHWAVAASSAGDLGFIIAIAFSTGMLALSPVAFIDHNATIPITGQYSAKNYDGSFLQTAIRAWYGTTRLGLPYQSGVQRDFAYDTLDANADWLQNSTITAEVKAFVPQYDCETARVSGITYFTKVEVGYLINTTQGWVHAEFESDSCKVAQDFEFDPDPSNFIVPQRVLHADWVNMDVFCDAGSTWQNDNQSTLGTSDIHLMRIVDLRFEQLIGPTLNRSALAWPYNNITGWNGTVADASAIICRPAYSIHSAILTVDTSLPAGQDVITAELQDQKLDRIAAFTDGNLSYAFAEPFYLIWDWALPAIKPVDGAMQRTGAYDGFWRLMSVQNGGSSLEAFLNADTLHDTAESLFQGVMSQFARQQLTVPATASVSGTRSYSQDRLEMKFVSTLVVGIVFVLLSVFLCLIFFFKATDVIPRDPASIATAATLLASNSTLAKIFENLGHASNADLEHFLYKSSFRSRMVPGAESGFIIERNETSYRTSITSDKNSDYWRPFPTSRLFAVFASLYTCALIAVMEVLGHLSHRMQGIASIRVSLTWAHEFSTVIPAVTMLIAFECYKAANDTISSFMPFSNLYRGRVAASKSIMMKTAGKIHVVNVVNGLRRRSLSLALISVAVFLGAFLSTIVAALYQIQPYSVSIPTEFTGIDQFKYDFRIDNSGPTDMPSDNTAGLVLGLIEQQNASYPPFVYDELVYPEFTIPSHAISPSENASIVVDLPATRAALRCDFAPVDSVEIDYYYPNRGSTTYGVVLNATLNLPEACHWSGLYSLPHEAAIGLRNQHDASYGSAIVNMLWDWITNERQTNSTCYSIGFVFGFFQYQNTHKSNITLMNCYQDIEIVNTTTTFFPASMRIDPHSPPVIHEHTRRTVAPNMLYRLSDVLDFNLMDFHLKGIDDDPGSTGDFGNQDDVPMEPFYQAVIYGPEGIPASELIGINNRENLFNATQHLYRKYMALLIHNNMRHPLPSSSSDSSPTYPGTIVDSTTLRVVQNPASKVALEVLLATMLVFTAIAYIMTPMRNVLPHNPCTIAGVMSLLAGSDLCSRAVIPEGAEFMTDRELEKVFEGYLFGLGWFGAGGDGEGGREGRFGIDVGQADKAG